MDFNIDKKIQFNGETKHSSLYEWCLNEVEANGKSSRNLIPWAWSFYFTASSLSVQREFGIDQKSDGDEKKEIRDITSIRGYLYSGHCSDGVNLDDYTSFSMFGTNRIVPRFDLNIYEADDGEEDSCGIWGCPSYETEIDFRNVVEDDCVVITIHLNSKKFNEFVRLIDAKQVSSAYIRLSNVDGFYSDWSPSIKTSDVSILTNDHVIEGIEGSGVEPPKLGNVGRFSFTLHSINDLVVKRNMRGMKGVEFYKQFEEAEEDEGDNTSFLNQIGFQQEKVENNASREQELVFYAKLINTLKIPLWLIFVALVLILVK